MKNSFLIVLCLLTISKLFGQTISVYSNEDKLGIPSAHLFLKDLKTGKESLVLTNEEGKATVQVTPPTKYLIKVSFLGYKTQFDTLVDASDKTYFLVSENTTLNEVVVTAQYAPNSPEKAVHRIKVIDNKKIEAMAAVNLRDVLTNELNVRLSQDNILGSSMSLQGIAGQNIKILIDGIPLTGRLNGNIDISQINMNNVERIEIIEGPLSVNYGTDALGGTINIITKKSQKKSFNISSSNYYESNGQYNFTGKIGFSKQKHFVGVTGGRNFFDGWRPTDKPFHIESKGPADSTRYSSWKPKEQYFGTLNYNYSFKTLKLGYTGDYFYEKITNRGLPRKPYFESAFDETYITNRINNSIFLTGKIGKNHYLNVLAAYNHFERKKNQYYVDLTNMNNTLTTNIGDQDTSIFNDIITRGTFSQQKANTPFNYEVGYDINHETSKGIRIKNTTQQIGDFALFSSAEYKPIPSLTFRPGIRVIYNTAYKAPLVPSINVKYSPKVSKDPDKTLGIRFSYARGFRSPSLKELYYYFVDINHNISGNENLKAENSNNFSLSTTYNVIKGERAWKVDFSLFYNAINNMISLAQSSGTQYTYFNLDKFKTMGAVLQGEYAIKHFKVSLGGSIIGRSNQFTNSTQFDQFTYSPEGRLNLFYEWHKQNMTFAFFYKYTGKLPTYILDSNDEISKTIMQDYNTADISITRTFFNKLLGVSIGAKNLFDVKTINGISTGSAHSSGNNSIAVGMGRTYFVKLDIQFNTKK
jgi:outer membrane receptor for ferrienterochelin and colicins